MTSRIDCSPHRIATMRSRPKAMPPCGGVPNSRASRKKPKRSRASSSRCPVAGTASPADAGRGYGCCRRRSRCRSARGRRRAHAPRPARLELRNVLVDRARERVMHRAVTLRRRRPTRSSGKSTTHRNSNRSRVEQVRDGFASASRSCPSVFEVGVGRTRPPRRAGRRCRSSCARARREARSSPTDLRRGLWTPPSAV